MVCSWICFNELCAFYDRKHKTSWIKIISNHKLAMGDPFQHMLQHRFLSLHKFYEGLAFF